MAFVRKHQELEGKLKEKADMQSTDKDFASLEEMRGVETLLRRVVKQKKLFVETRQTTKSATCCNARCWFACISNTPCATSTQL